MLTPTTERCGILLAAGVPAEFLAALERSDEAGDRCFKLKTAEDAYFYLPQILDYAILRDAAVTPLCCGSNGDTYYTLLQRGDVNRFVYFELEQDEIYRDFGADFRLVLMDIFVHLAGFIEGDEQILRVAERFAFPQCPRLLTALDREPRADWDVAWLKRNVDEVFGV